MQARKHARRTASASGGSSLRLEFSNLTRRALSCSSSRRAFLLLSVWQWGFFCLPFLWIVNYLFFRHAITQPTTPDAMKTRQWDRGGARKETASGDAAC